MQLKKARALLPAIFCALLLLCGCVRSSQIIATVPDPSATASMEESLATMEESLATMEESLATLEEPAQKEVPTDVLDKDGSYTSKEDVSLYILSYGRLPGNFISKAEARALGWSAGGLQAHAPGKCIGGDRFGNYEGLLPEADGRKYYECDIDTLGAPSRGAKRIVFSNDGLIYYTNDHYGSFTLLYGEERG